MNDKLWTITLANGQTETVTCEVCGVAQDGSLICFLMENGNPIACKGYAPNVWTTFSRSSIRVH